MGRIRVLTNCEFYIDLPNGDTQRVLYGASTYFEAEKVETYLNEGERFANIYMSGDKVLNGVVWQVFENHGTPETDLGDLTVREQTDDEDQVDESGETTEEET